MTRPSLYPEGQQTVLNAYALSSPALWTVQVYRIEPLGPAVDSSEIPRDLKRVMYDYARRTERSSNRWAFWRLDDDHVAAPENCMLPAHASFKGYSITPAGTRTVSTRNPDDDLVVREILKSAVRESLRQSTALGQLIQDGSRFIEVPDRENRQGDVHFCRQYEVFPRPVRLSGGERHWTLQLAVHTLSLDAEPLSAYYKQGNVERLADLIRAKRKNRRTREGAPTGIRVLYQGDGDYRQFGKLTEPEQIFDHADYPASDQRDKSDLTFACELYQKGGLKVINLPGSCVHLVMDTQLTGEHHDETILATSERLGIYRRLMVDSGELR